MSVKRMDNVGIVVEDLDAAIGFFSELGLGEQLMVQTAPASRQRYLAEPAGRPAKRVSPSRPSDGSADGTSAAR